MDDNDLTPTEYLCLEVLVARYRLGETMWTFPTSVGKALKGLQDKRFIGYKSGIVEKTYLAWLEDKGIAEGLSPDYTSPHERLLMEAFGLEG